MQALVIPILVVGTLVSMLVQMPPTVMDFLIGANLIFALALLLSALSLTDTLKLTSLPSLLLLATLFRLALNVSSTRNILGGGEAGQIIDAFGKVVVNGNLVVGIVIFSIITLVQFIVVAKGSERVAEVAARFTLDALPGKQMSIDADLRSGILDLNQARSKRQDLQTESRFYGALDGAMKFVKGDAIAGIVITLINLVGGITVGALLGGMDIGAAIQKYSLLTVGDGLTAQIPSLLNSLAAGIVVTRVSRGDERTLAQDLIQQLSAARSVKVLIAIFCFAVACAPEMPVLPFITLGALLLWSAVMHAAEKPDNEANSTPWSPRPPAPISVTMDSKTFADLLGSAEKLSAVNRTARERTFNALGLSISNIEFAPDTERKGVAVLIRGIESERYEDVPTEGELVGHICDVIRRNALELIDDSMTRRLLDSLDPVMSDSANTIIPSAISVTQVTELLRSLVAEHVSIQSFDVILQSISEHAPRSPNPRVLLEEVRIAMKRIICSKFAKADSPTHALRMNALIDYEICKLEREGASLTFPLMERISEFLKANIDTRLLLVSRGARRLVQQLVGLYRMDIQVVAFEELVESLKVSFVATLECDQEAPSYDEEARLAA